MAYRSAEQERWKQFDFVVGYEVKITQNGNHVEDICDCLQGKYPKEFTFMGWHPHCLCYTIPILKTEDEFFDGDDDAKSVNEVEDVPASFKDWVADNADRIEAAEERGTLPYFIRDNRGAVNAVLNPETPKTKTEESKSKTGNEERRARNRALYDKLKDNPEYTDVAFHVESGGMKATQIGHNFDGKKGWYESSAQNVGYKNGHSVIFKKEDHTKHKIKNNEGIWDGLPFEVAGCETGIDVNIRNGLKHCASKPDTQIAVLFFPNDNFDVSIFEVGYAKYFGLRHDPKQYRKFDLIYCVNKENIIYIKKPD